MPHHRAYEKTDLRCECGHEWEHARRAWVGRDRVGFVKDSWGVLRCPKCLDCRGVRLNKKEDINGTKA